ncbi:MAG: hypothetical protein ACXABY_12470 [Candidatus Thorarchaeota archaeon]|jgi:hypothetical protein
MKHSWPILLVATLKKLLLYNPNSHGVKVLREGGGPFYGLSWDEDRLFLGDRRGAGGDKLYIYDKDFHEIESPNMILNHHHQIFYLGKKLYITDTGMDRVAIWDGESTVYRDWNYEIRKEYNKHEHDRDMHHINSLWAPSRDSQEIWVGYHNMTFYSNRPSEVKVMDLDLTKVLRSYTIGESLHNIFMDDHKLYICNSGKEELLEYHTGNFRTRQLGIGRWTRGLGATSDYFVVGGSMIGMGLEREGGNLTLSLVHRPSWEVVDRRNLEANGAVFELRIVDQPDLAHNGIDCPLDWRSML